MSKGGKGRKKLALPVAPPLGGKRTGDPSALLPGAATSLERVSWRFTHVDHDGRWGFDQIEPAALCEMLRKLGGIESMTVAEIRASRGFFTEYELPSGLCKEALARLSAMNREDMTKISRLRFSNTQRLYGFLEDNVFHVVWWDPNHDVYPTSPRNT